MEKHQRLFWVMALTVVLAARCTCQAPTPEECAVDPNARMDCGYPGISKAICNNKGCCFDNKISGVVWCFQPQAEEACEL